MSRFALQGFVSPSAVVTLLSRHRASWGCLRTNAGLTAIVYADEPTNTMPKDSDIPHRNRNHTGWWIFREVQQWVADGQKKLSDHSRCPVWENTRLLRAKNRKKAYKKAMRLCQAGHPSKTNGGEWRSAGISMLLPVYDEIEDGAEILWTDHGLMTVRKIQTLIKTKDQLPVFDDTNATGDHLGQTEQPQVGG